MTAAFHRKSGIRKLKRRILFLVFILLALFNMDNIARFYYPFPYREQINFYAAQYQLDPFLLAAMIKTESNFDKQAVSGKGARGLMQIMPETGLWVARQMNIPSFNVDQLFDPETSIKLGAWYLADLNREFHGDTVLVLAAYNGGRGNVNQWLDTKQLQDTKVIEQIPFAETRHYVRKVLTYQLVYRYLYQEADAHPNDCINQHTLLSIRSSPFFPLHDDILPEGATTFFLQ